ncbi:MAG TPA: uroporphyrinogen-III synthase [Candidatus Polarisedimenticolaceae bacterium]|nr:uroporphyrinogen-III synthase [Candidatus Polarisedimenticolaceae bacterium]
MTPLGRPLYERVILITRPEPRNAELKRKLEALGARVEARPTIALEAPADFGPPERALRRLDDYDWLLFTSPSGVRFFLLLAQRFLGKLPRIRGSIAAVGPATGSALRAAGLRPAVVAGRSSAEGLAEAVEGRLRRGHRVLQVRPEEAREVLPEALRAAGAIVDSVPFYRNVAARDVPRIARDIRRELFDAIVFTSPSTLLRLLEGAAREGIEIVDAMRRTKLVAIGEITATALADAGLTTHAVAEKPSDDGIAQAVTGLF